MSYAELFAISNFTFLRGASHPEELVLRSRELGLAGLAVNEHAARLVKKAVVGTGGADKAQVQAMLKILLPGATIAGADAADALAVAIADAHLIRSA